MAPVFYGIVVAVILIAGVFIVAAAPYLKAKPRSPWLPDPSGDMDVPPPYDPL